MSKNQFYLNDITEAIGNIPLVKLNRMTQKRGIKATVLVKPEYMNPSGSVKDRMAVYILKQAINRGELKPGGTIVEGTSGNTGAAVAMFAAANGYKAIFTIPDKMSDEKIDALKAFGAEVHICPTDVPAESPESYYQTAIRISKETENCFYIGQYFNLDNIEAHYNSTGPEIWEQTKGEFDVLVAGVGTGGTISGSARYLKEKKPEIKVIGADPIGSIYYNYHTENKMIEPHTYHVEGIGEDMLCPTVDFSVIDKIFQVSDKDCFLSGRELTRTEGIFGGGSSGAAIHVAMEYAKELDENQTMIIIIPDSGVKYMSKMFNDNWMREKGFLE